MNNEVRRLKEIKKENHYSDEMIARKLGVSFLTVNRWLNGKTEPSQLALEKLQDYLLKH